MGFETRPDAPARRPLDDLDAILREVAKVDPPLDPENTLVEQVAELRERLNTFRRCLGILAGIARPEQMERYRRRLREEGIVPTRQNGGSDEGRS